MPVDREFGSGVYVSHRSEIWIMGGTSLKGYHDDVHRYDCMTNIWHSLPSLNQARGAAMSFVYDDMVYVAGGYGPDKVMFDSVERYSFVDQKWHIMPW
jgi:N-acetylneuraminic acid mutarotase